MKPDFARGTVGRGDRPGLRAAHFRSVAAATSRFSANDDVCSARKALRTCTPRAPRFSLRSRVFRAKRPAGVPCHGTATRTKAISNLSAPWICVSTTEGHVAYVEILRTPGVGSAELDLKYTVWY